MKKIIEKVFCVLIHNPSVLRILPIFFYTLLVFKSTSLNGQMITNYKIESLQRVANRLQLEINIKTDSLNLINEEINRQKIKAYELLPKSQNEGFSIITKVKGDFPKIRKSNNPISDIILNLKEGDNIKLTDYQKGYWVVNVGPFYGYLNDMYINQDDYEITTFKKELIKRNEEYRMLKLQETLKEQRLMEEQIAINDKIQNEIDRKIAIQKFNEKKEYLYKRFGKEIAEKIIKKMYWLGMTSEMAELSLGSPRSKNKSVGSWGVHEQWVYYSTYLYFENGKLTSYQKTE